MTDQTMGAGRPRPRGRGARAPLALPPGAHPHPGLPAHTAAHRRRRAARGVQADARPVRRAGRGGHGHGARPARHRHRPGRPAGADRHGQGGRHARPALGRAVRARHRVRVERGRDRAPRHHDEASGVTSRASTCSPCARSGPRTKPSSTASTSTSSPVVVVAQAGDRRASGAHRRRGRSEDVRRTSPSTPTAGSRSAAPASGPRSPSCTRPASRSGATRRRCASFRSARSPTQGKLEYYASLGMDGDRPAQSRAAPPTTSSPSSTGSPPSPAKARVRCTNPSLRWVTAQTRRDQRRSMMVTLAWPPPSHIVWRP